MSGLFDDDWRAVTRVNSTRCVPHAAGRGATEIVVDGAYSIF